MQKRVGGDSQRGLNTGPFRRTPTVYRKGKGLVAFQPPAKTFQSFPGDPLLAVIDRLESDMARKNQLGIKLPI
jgi:hypothetical protein